MDIQTPNLRLVLQSTEDVLARIEAMSPADQAEVSPDWLARLRATSISDPWTHGFAVVRRADDVVVGSCGYRGPPDPAGVVEIAYGVNAEYRGRGYATEVAAALTRYAFDTGQVKIVCALTRAEQNASTRVLSKCGFRWVGEWMDPEDGSVWRWEHERGAASS